MVARARALPQLPLSVCGGMTVVGFGYGAGAAARRTVRCGVVVVRFVGAGIGGKGVAGCGGVCMAAMEGQWWMSGCGGVPGSWVGGPWR